MCARRTSIATTAFSRRCRVAIWLGFVGNSLNYQGERKIKTTLCDDHQTSIPATLNFAVAGVTNPVLSLGLMVESGMEFLFSKSRGCWMSEDVFDITSLALEIDRDGNTFYIHEEDKPVEEPLKAFAVEADDEEDPDQGWGIAGADGELEGEEAEHFACTLCGLVSHLCASGRCRRQAQTEGHR